MLRDLINNVTYELKLTPVTVTGKLMNELAVVTRGTPNGNGFSAGPDDPVPPDIIGHPGAPPPPPPIDTNVPTVPGSGIPFALLGTLLGAAALFGVYWMRMQKERKTAKEFLAAMQERYHS